jgi:hypothetical protein
MIRRKFLQIRVKLLIAVLQSGVPLFRLDARRTLFVQLLLEAGFCHFDFSTEMAEVVHQCVLALQYNTQLVSKLRDLLKSISEVLANQGDRMGTCRFASIKNTP